MDAYRREKYLIVSDSHGNNDNIREAVRAEMPFSYMVHLGDFETPVEEIQRTSGALLDIVSGNCDPFSKIPRVKVIRIGKYCVFLTHGHLQGVNYGFEALAEAAKEKNCQIALFGHIHLPVDEYVNGVRLINPGSLSRPFQEDHRRAYGVIETDENGEIRYFQRFLDTPAERV